MAMVTYPLNNIEYSAEDAELFHVTRTSGVYATNSFDYSITGADNTIVIGKGIAWIKNSEFSGKVVAQKEPVSIDIGLPDPNYERIDSIAIQFDANKNASEIVVKNGVPSSNPTAPSVVRTESIYELHLYHVRRSAGSLTISANNITDLRSNNNYCGLMTDSVTQAVDTTLSKQGVAADAAAVGDALKLKAPSGYGLGSAQIFTAATIDEITKPGFYFNNESMTIGGVTSTRWWMDVCAYGTGTNFATQRLFAGANLGYELIRRKVNGAWRDWEWVNPPMILGVEYRTTELYKGNPVYKMRYLAKLTFGVADGVGNADIGFLSSFENISEIIRCDAMVGSGEKLPYISKSGGVTAITEVHPTGVSLRSVNTVWKNKEFIFDLAYTKTS